MSAQRQPSMESWRHKMATYTLIESQVLGSTTASVTFSAIDQTFTDLVLKYSPRGSAAYAASNLIMKFNGSTSGYSDRLLYTNNGTSALSYQQSAQAQSDLQYLNQATSTANTFSNNEIYIPNYTSANYKSFSSETAAEDNATAAILGVDAGLWSNAAAITSIYLAPNTGSFVQYSSFYLYGISNTI